MDHPNPTEDQLIERLTRAESPLRDELAALVVDGVLGMRLRDAADLDRARELGLHALSAPNADRFIARHLRPGLMRYAASIADRDTRLRALVPERALERLRALAAKLRAPSASSADGLIDPVLLRRLLAPVFTQVLAAFARRLPIPGLGGTGDEAAAPGLTGTVARSVMGQAGKLLDRGRHAMGGLGAEVERRLLDAARAFSGHATDIFRQALRERARSDEGRSLIAQIAAGAVDRLLDVRLADVQRDLEAQPLDELFALAPELLAHAAPSAYVQEIVRREIEAYLALEGDRPLRELLEEHSVYAETRALLLERVSAVLREVLQSPGFAAWLSRLLST